MSYTPVHLSPASKALLFAVAVWICPQQAEGRWSVLCVCGSADVSRRWLWIWKTQNLQDQTDHIHKDVLKDAQRVWLRAADVTSPAGEVEAAGVATGGSLLAESGFFRTTRDPRAPLPLSVPTLLSQLSDLAFFTPVPDVPCSTHNTSVISPLTCSS